MISYLEISVLTPKGGGVTLVQGDVDAIES